MVACGLSNEATQVPENLEKYIEPQNGVCAVTGEKLLVIQV